MDKEEIIRRSKEIFHQFTDTCLQIPEEKFFLRPAEKWSIAENADHMVRSIKATGLAYSLPKFVMRIFSGKPNRASRSYEELVAKYKLKLEQGGKASGRYIPKVAVATKFTLMQHWQKLNEKYLESLELNWKDSQLDHYVAPHPLLGKITLRELCYFTIYHTEHHLNIIKTRLLEQHS
ncbi:MAG TPA: DinB family protein [Chitinophagaceae bacterium]|nr:DinB family protein [Chitinophagaceae bacterium]